MGKPGAGIRKIVQKYSETYELRTNGEDDGYYDDDGDFIRPDRAPTTIRLHWQPLTGKEAQNLPENLRSKTVYKYWTLETGKLDLKNQVIIDGKIYTIETIQEYQLSHAEGMMSRSGTKQNIDES